MYIDTHCHLQDEKYKNDNVDEIIFRMIEAGTGIVIVSGYDENSNVLAVEMTKCYPEVYATVGYHPSELDHIYDDDLLNLEKLLSEPKVVALGEIGLDYHYFETDKERQKKMFIKQLNLANSYKKPIVVHSRDAAADTYDILKKHKSAEIRGHLHCYAYSYEMALKFVDLNMMLGVTGVLTYKNSVQLKEVVRQADLKYLLVETDGPYLSPEPVRGTINKPENIKYIVQKIAEIKGISEEKVGNYTTQNALSLFDISL